MREKPIITYSKEPVLEPKEGCAWADTMVLNPALVLDEDGKTIHMLFRATGPWPSANLKGKSDPYPIFLGYAKSTDMGESFEADFERPALAPKLAYDEQDMYVINDKGEKVINYANGCIEDPRLFYIGAQLYLTVACRLFPPGPYWEGDKRKDNLPDWVMDPDSPVGVLARRNDTVTVLYKVDLKKLKEGSYEEAFSYVGPLTDGNLSDNRDVFFFPKRMNIGGAEKLVMLHRCLSFISFLNLACSFLSLMLFCISPSGFLIKLIVLCFIFVFDVMPFKKGGSSSLNSIFKSFSGSFTS